MAREFLMCVVESSFGTPKATPVLGTDSFYIRLDDGNAFTPRMTPLMFEIMYGGGEAISAITGSDVVEVKGQLKTKLYASQAKFLLPWGITRINAGQTLPWTTTEIAGNLASMSVYHAKQRADGTFKRNRYAGMKVEGGTLESSRDAKIWTLTLDLVGSKVVGNAFDSSTDPTSTEFPAPTDTQLPMDPYTFGNSGGGLTVGTVRTQYDSLKLSWKNTLDVKPFESRFAQLIQWCGRKSGLEAKLNLKASPDDRATYEAITANAVSLLLGNGTNTATIDFKGQNVFEGIDDDLDLQKIYMYTLKVKNQRDNSAGTDISVTTT
jgi:hypothetical protein